MDIQKTYREKIQETHFYNFLHEYIGIFFAF